MDILIVYSDPYCSCTRKNTFELGKALNNIDEDVVCNIVFFPDLTEDHFDLCDIIIFQRLGGNGGIIRPSFIQKIGNLAKKYKGKTLTYYNIDDLLMNNEIIHLSQIVDYLLFPHKGYTTHFKQFEKEMRYTGPFVDKETIDEVIPFDLGNDNIKLLWASTALLGQEFMQQLLPQIKRNLPEVEVYIIGQDHARYRSFTPHTFGNMNFSEYIGFCKACDIHLNPLSLDRPKFINVEFEDFLKCKCPVKYLNAAITKTPMISSNFEPYNGIMINEINGIIIENNPQLWIEKIKKLINNTLFKEQLVSNAYKLVSENFTVKHTASRLVEIFKKDLKEIQK